MEQSFYSISHPFIIYDYNIVYKLTGSQFIILLRPIYDIVSIDGQPRLIKTM